MRLRFGKRLEGASADSLFLAFVKFFTLGTGIINTMILSHSLTLEAYGTYSQGNLIVTLCADATILGLADAANYFFNRGSDRGRLEDYVNTVFTIQLVVGTATALGIVLAQESIVGYFDNPLLRPIFVYIAFRPMLTNMASVMQVLVVSVGKARMIAVRNAAFSLLKLLAVLLTALVTSSVAILFAVLLVLDLLTAAWFWAIFRRSRFAVRPVPLRAPLVREILAFSVPMAVYVLTNSFTRQLGALVIGANESTGDYAIYANCATVLPLDVVSASFLTVMVPLVTRYIGSGDFPKARELFRHYLAIGYLTTATFSVACLVVAPEMVRVLYGESYLPGLPVFRLYLVAGMVKFANLSLILSASGKTRSLMAVSVSSVVVNAAACVAAYSAIGFEGPAVATVAVYVATMAALLFMSMRELRGRVSDAFDPRAVASYVASTASAAALGVAAKALLSLAGVPWLLSAALTALLVVGVTLLLNRKHLAASLRAINRMK